MIMDDKSKIKKGLVWSSIERFSAQGLQFLLGIILARLLMPSDYGLIAMISVFIGIGKNIVDSGFVDALIQKKEKKEEDFNTTFFFNISLGLVFYGILFFIAPFISSFYKEPELIAVIRVLGALPFVASLCLVFRAKLMIELRFKALAISNILAVVISGVISVWMAYSGFGVWSLVAQSIINYFMAAVFMCVCVKWIPKFNLSLDSFKSLWGFGSKLLFTAIINTIYHNLYALVLGKRYSSVEAGLFNRSQSLTMFPAQNISLIILKVIYPVQCKIQDDTEKLKDNFLLTLRFSCFVIFPMMLGLVALAKPLVMVLLKEQWIDTVPILQILALAYMWNSMMLFNTNILNVKGRTDFTLKAEIYKKIIGVLLLFGLLPLGIKAVAFGVLLYSIVDILVITYFVKKVINISIWTELKEVFPAFLLSVIMGALVYLCNFIFDNNYIILAVGICVGVAFYFLMAYLFKFKEIGYLRENVLKKKC